MSEVKAIGQMKWSEIPVATPMYEILEAIGFPSPMVILKHLNKPDKKGKKRDLNSIVSFLWMSKEDLECTVKSWYHTASNSDTVRQYLAKHPKQALLLIRTWNQFNEEPISVVAARNLNEWRQLLVEEGIWESLMKETPLTLIERAMKLFSETDYLNMPLGEFWNNWDAEAILEKASIKAVADKFVEAEEEERRMKELQAELKAAGLGNFASFLKNFGS